MAKLSSVYRSCEKLKYEQGALKWCAPERITCFKTLTAESVIQINTTNGLYTTRTHAAHLSLWFPLNNKPMTITFCLQGTNRCRLPRDPSIIKLSLCGWRQLWGRISGDFPQVLRNMTVGSQQISIWVGCGQTVTVVCTQTVQVPLQQHPGQLHSYIIYWFFLCECWFHLKMHNLSWWACKCHPKDKNLGCNEAFFQWKHYRTWTSGHCGFYHKTFLD